MIEKQGKSSIFLGHNPAGETGSNYKLGALLDCLEKVPTSLVIFSQEKIWAHHGETLLHELSFSKIPLFVYLLPDREACKTMDSFSSALEFMVEKDCDRNTSILAFGGGTVGDCAGFVAATFMRGISWLYIPTTLLAMQDASVGGKVAINLKQGKNLAGAFWQPEGVTIDLNYLTTLPEREFQAGSMEWIKHCVLKGGTLYEQIDAFPKHFSLPFHDWDQLAHSGVKVKIEIVNEDFLELGLRKTLNLGHTMAHAIEKITDYRLLHGESVGLGLIYACVLANELGSTYTWDPLFKWILARLPMSLIREELTTNQSFNKVLDYTKFDKKKSGGKVTWIIPMQPGDIIFRNDIPFNVLEKTQVRWKQVLGLT